MKFRFKGHLTGLDALAALVGGILAGILVFGWGMLGDLKKPRILRSRLTLVVETPEGERTGSSVTETRIRFPGGLMNADGYSTWVDLSGEAVVVDLGSRGLLFATFESQAGLARGGGDMYNAAFAPFPQKKYVRETDHATNDFDSYIAQLIRLKPKSDLSIKDFPILVRFRDPSRSATVELVDPLNLAANFGAGVTLKSAAVEITDDPITKVIETKLPWLASSKFSPTLVPLQDLKRAPRTVAQTPPAEDLQYNDLRRLPR